MIDGDLKVEPKGIVVSQSYSPTTLDIIRAQPLFEGTTLNQHNPAGLKKGQVKCWYEAEDNMKLMLSLGAHFKLIWEDILKYAVLHTSRSSQGLDHC